MPKFLFIRFATLLIRVLEVSIIAGLLLRWAAIFLIVRPETNALGGTVMDVAANFCFLAIACLLVGDLWLLLARRPHAVFATLRTFLYIVLCLVGPYRLGGLPENTTERPNQAIELTPGRGTTQLSHV